MNAQGRSASRVARGRRRTGRSDDPDRVRAPPCLAAVQRPEALEIDAAGKHLHARAVTPGTRGSPARHPPAKVRRDDGDQVEQRQRGHGDRPRARVSEVGPVQRHGVNWARHGQRRPGRQAEMRVDHVEAPSREQPPEPVCGLNVGTDGAAGDRLDLDRYSLERLQRSYLVVDEPAEGRAVRRRPHVRDDECVDRAMDREACSPATIKPHGRDADLSGQPDRGV